MPTSTTCTLPLHASPTNAPLLIDVYRLSVLLDRSVAALNRDQAAGRLPAPVRIGGSRKWRRDEIDAWVQAGCPTYPSR